jgi:hypothetical protein
VNPTLAETSASTGVPVDPGALPPTAPTTGQVTPYGEAMAAVDVSVPAPGEGGPALPTTYSDAELQAAVGVSSPAPAPAPIATAAPPKPPRKKKKRDTDDDDGEPKPSGSRAVLFVALALIVGVGVVTLIVLGLSNSDRYFITCEPDKVVAEQGRTFPPWGSRALSGPEWKPITLSPTAECKPMRLDDQQALAKEFLDRLVKHASSLLEAREVTKVDLASEQLAQALLLARSPDSSDARKDIERLLGDVDYWRASAKLRDAATALGDAAKQFETASAQNPRHVRNAQAWATHIKRVVDELHAGPDGAPSALPALPSQGTPEHSPAPPGTALPVEPDRATEIAPPAPDAGVPTGGVLM